MRHLFREQDQGGSIPLTPTLRSLDAVPAQCGWTKRAKYPPLIVMVASLPDEREAQVRILDGGLW